MSKLTEFVENHRTKDGTVIRSAIISTDNAYLEAGLEACGLAKGKDYSIIHYDEAMPPQMQNTFAEIKPELRHMYCMFEGPLQKSELKTVKHLALDDPCVISMMEQKEKDMEDYPEPVTL